MRGKSLVLNSGVDPSAFDAFALSYDDAFTRSRLGRLLRSRVWKTLITHFSEGQHILELACGTGEDAVWLAKQGVCVTATDGSAEMIRIAETKAATAGVSDRITAIQFSFQDAIAENFAGRQLAAGSRFFDGVFSNFGGLNTLGDWRPLAESLAKIVKPDGKLILVPMGPVCPWEIIWYMGHGQLRTAFRRFGRRASAQIGDAEIPIWYPSAKKLKADFSPWFEHVHTESFGLWLPPSYIDHLVDRWPNLFNKLNHFERNTARLTQGWGDHYIIIFQRQDLL